MCARNNRLRAATAHALNAPLHEDVSPSDNPPRIALRLRLYSRRGGDSLQHVVENALGSEEISRGSGAGSTVVGCRARRVIRFSKRMGFIRPHRATRMMLACRPQAQRANDSDRCLNWRDRKGESRSASNNKPPFQWLPPRVQGGRAKNAL